MWLILNDFLDTYMKNPVAFNNVSIIGHIFFSLKYYWEAKKKECFFSGKFLIVIFHFVVEFII